MRGLWLRWTWRDLRSRWPQVVATALILGVGIGGFAGLGGLREWREESADLSMAALNAHDLRVDLAEGAFVEAQRLRAVADALPGDAVAASEARLVVPSQVDATGASGAVLVPARVIGIPVADGAQPVDGVHVREGAGLSPGGHDVVLDWSFADHYGLDPSGTVRLGGREVRYRGLGSSPQYFVIVDETGISGAESGLAVVYAPLADVQAAAGRPGSVNQLLVRAAPGADVAALERALAAALRRELPDAGATIVRADDEPVTAILYRDARNDQRTFSTFAVLILFGAALAAFNLVSRVVEAQRREIGIGMALGVEPRLLAVRPLALGAQIGVLGAILAFPAGIGLSELIKSLMRDFLPLPVSASVFPWELFAGAAVAGALIPVAAAALPVRRAVGVQPVEAIRTGARTAVGGGATGVMRRLRLPGRPLTQLPLRNLARTPRRTVMTVIGLGVTLTLVVAILGMVDSIRDVADRHERELLHTSPTRVEVALRDVVAADGPEVAAVRGAPGVARAEPVLTVRGALAADGGEPIAIALGVVDAGSRVWAPTVEEGRATGGVLLARRAAEDLGVGVGDRVTLRHPRAAGDGMAVVDTPVTVAGIHGGSIRALAYADREQAAALGLGGIANAVAVVPAAGTSEAALARELAALPQVASVQPASAEASAIQTSVDAFQGAINIVGVMTLGLALLVAFTSTSVSVEERRREYATMFAFGLPPREGLRVATTESVVTGVLGTLLGIGLGVAVSGWVIHTMVADSFPDLGAEVVLTPATIAIAFAVGVVAVAFAPLLTFRRLRRMDIPSTLRVVE